MDGTFDFLVEHPFLSGLLVGLFVAAVIWVRGWAKKYAHEREVQRLKDMLHTKLELEARSQRALHDELESLRKHNENLRITVKSLQQRPDRAELRQLHVYDAAIRTLLARSPGFGPAWQSVLEESERQMAEQEKGLGAFVRRVFSPRSVPVLTENTRPVDTDPSPEDS